MLVAVAVPPVVFQAIVPSMLVIGTPEVSGVQSFRTVAVECAWSVPPLTLTVPFLVPAPVQLVNATKIRKLVGVVPPSRNGVVKMKFPCTVQVMAPDMVTGGPADAVPAPTPTQSPASKEHAPTPSKSLRIMAAAFLRQS